MCSCFFSLLDNYNIQDHPDRVDPKTNLNKDPKPKHEEHSSRTHQTQLSNQTKSRTIKGRILFVIMHRTRIKDPFALIIIKST